MDKLFIHFMDIYHKLIRLIRTGDYKLYICLLPEIANLFFFIKSLNSYPGITKKFENDSVSIRRTKKSFSRIPIDLTLDLE